MIASGHPGILESMKLEDTCCLGTWADGPHGYTCQGGTSPAAGSRHPAGYYSRLVLGVKGASISLEDLTWAIARAVRGPSVLTGPPQMRWLQLAALGGLIWLTRGGRGTSLAVRWLRLCASTAGGTGSIPGRGTKIPHAAWCGQTNKNKTKQTRGGREIGPCSARERLYRNGNREP